MPKHNPGITGFNLWLGVYFQGNVVMPQLRMYNSLFLS